MQQAGRRRSWVAGSRFLVSRQNHRLSGATGQCNESRFTPYLTNETALGIIVGLKKSGGCDCMKARLLALVLGFIALSALAIPAFAHHSFSAEFDRNKRVSLTGIITSVKWQNPHVYFYIDVK